jgi:uncharacterized protein
MSGKRHWFLPETPDVRGMLRRQLAVTREGADAFAAWAAGDAAAGHALHEIVDRGDAIRRELLNELREAFVTPLEPEDVFALSRGIDRILNYEHDLVGESEAMATLPDGGIAEMGRLLCSALGHLDSALEQLGSDGDAAIAAADEALADERAFDRTYYAGMAALLTVEDRQERIGRRELYRGCARIGDTLVDVAERVIYAVVKQS